ncbi:hypothetical protein L5F43_07965 [Aliarcobacter butzleri]|uniref:hypothetical protein n=1 Tax=Aliarcobacter butzleri TaxID=28197 RepID=UPI001EDAF94F|nr:hypothetical protein [Aliarcobacter butzleri]MCG3706418.1 hypothetical protein [Aliarcobacter butzleri]
MISRKKQLFEQIEKEKKLRCKIIDLGGMFVCLVDATAGTIEGRALGVVAYERGQDNWTLDRVFDLQTKVGRFQLDEWTRLDVAEFNDIKEETIEFKYINKNGKYQAI